MEGPSKKKKKIEKQCSFGCHHGQQCSESEYQSFLDLADDEQTVYRWRAGINPDINITSICEFHKNYFGDSEFKRKSKCCDPNKVHKKVKKPDGSHTITLEWAMQLKLKSIDVVPGWKLCRNCHKHIKELLENDTDSVDDEFLPEAQECALDSTLNTSEKREELNEYWQMMGISPLKTHAVPTASKIKDASEKITRSQEKQKELAKELFNLPSTSLLEKREKIEISTDIQRKAEQFDRLMFLFKEKLSDKATTSSQKLQILTMAPLDWSRQQVAKFFEVSEYLVREARKLAAEKGILALPDAKKGRSLSKEVEDSVRLFFEDDEYSRQMPGTKDFVSVSRNVHKQKRLLLCNLKELHQAYKAKFPDHKISLSKFCQLRPKWCVTIAASGSHSVCVCKIHQNAKLMVDAFSGTVNTAIRKREREYLQEIAEREENGDSPLAEKSFPLCNVTYKDLMKIAVCDLDNMQCMVHRCDSCPTYTALQLYIERLFEEYDICDDITYSQWDSTDRTTLHTSTASVEEFIENLVYSIDSLTTHSFIARSQSQFLKSRKEAIDNTTAIVLVDFAENYHYIVQDEIQGYHWNKDQCTIHPVVIYYKDENDKLAHMSLSIISDDLEHDTTFVHEIQRLVCQHIRATLPDINSIEYWSDGCAGQYKNYKNFMNLCHHEEDFHLKATWSFFATSHGKSPCDGIGGTVKRMIVRASLQRPIADQILTFPAVDKFCRENIPSITFFTVFKADMIAIRKRLDERYSKGSTVPGTRSCHYFEPLTTNTIRAKQLSTEVDFLINSHAFSIMPSTAEIELTVHQNDYATVLYDNHWWLAFVEVINMEEKDIECRFLHPHGPLTNNNFHWPSRDDRGYIPFDKVIMRVETPKCTSNSGRQFSMLDKELKHTNDVFKQCK